MTIANTAVKDADNNTINFVGFDTPNGRVAALTIVNANTGLSVSNTSPLFISSVDTPGFTPSQTFVNVPTFVSGDTTGTANTNGTIVQVLAANPNRKFLSIENNGGNDIELWFSATKPSDNTVNQSVRQGKVIFANGGGLLRTDKVETSAIFANSNALGSSGLAVIEG